MGGKREWEIVSKWHKFRFVPSRVSKVSVSNLFLYLLHVYPLPLTKSVKNIAVGVRLPRKKHKNWNKNTREVAISAIWYIWRGSIKTVLRCNSSVYSSEKLIPDTRFGLFHRCSVRECLSFLKLVSCVLSISITIQLCPKGRYFHGCGWSSVACILVTDIRGNCLWHKLHSAPSDEFHVTEPHSNLSVWIFFSKR